MTYPNGAVQMNNNCYHWKTRATYRPNAWWQWEMLW